MIGEGSAIRDSCDRKAVTKGSGFVFNQKRKDLGRNSFRTSKRASKLKDRSNYKKVPRRGGSAAESDHRRSMMGWGSGLQTKAR